MKLKNILPVFALAGCVVDSVPSNPIVAPPENSSEVMELAWAAWNAPGKMPEVEWMGGNCLQSDGSAEGDSRTNPKCLLAEYGPELNTAWVINQGNVFASGAVVHEFLHAALYARTGNADRCHTRPEWENVDSINWSICDELGRCSGELPAVPINEQLRLELCGGDK